MKFFAALGLVSLCLTASAADKHPDLSVQESFHLKKISEFWKDGDYEASKNLISFFLEKYPKSSASDSLYAMLGDLFLREGRFEDALTAYEQIQDESVGMLSLGNQIQCLFELRDYRSVEDLSRDYFGQEYQDKEEVVRIHFVTAESLFIRAVQETQMENKLKLLHAALPHYLALSKTKYETLSLSPLAEIYKIQGEHTKAAQAYQLLAQKYPEKKEQLLFQVALLELKFNQEKAAQTFGAVAELRGKRAKVATFNKIALLFQQKKYNDLILTAQSAAHFLTQEELKEFDFYLGKSYCAQGDIQKAIVHLQAWASREKTASKQLRSAYLSLIRCAKESKNDVLFKASFDDLFAFFPTMEGEELFLADYILLLSQNKKWNEARDAARFFVTEFPSNSNAPLMLRHLLYSSKQLQKPSQWISDLELALDQPLAQQEKQGCHRLLIKAFWETGDYTQALKEIKGALEEAKDDAELHLIAALCHKKLNLPTASFIYHAEKALSLNKELHVQLYNAYLSQYLEQHEEKNVNSAAHHLWEYFLVKPAALKTENIVWLASHAYAKALKGDSLAFERATVLLESLLNPETLTIAEKTLYLETEALKLAELYSKKGNSVKKIALLEALKKNYEQHPSLEWKVKKRALFELAQTYEGIVDKEKALKTYELILASSPHVSSYLADASLLQKVRLQYGFLTDRQEKNPQIVQILSDLKNLQIKRTLSSEPIHLEAALEYAEIRTALSAPAAKEETRLFFLRRLKEDFLASEDAISREYHACRAKTVDKETLFQAYMKYVDAEILLAEAKNGQKNNPELQAKATSALNELLKDKDNLHPALLKRLQRQRDAL